MLKRSDVVALSKAALQRVASGKAGVVPPNKEHVERLAKKKKDVQKAADEARRGQRVRA